MSAFNRVDDDLDNTSISAQLSAGLLINSGEAHCEQPKREFDRTKELVIELLQERRTALISTAVTGKIDVRETAFHDTI